MNPYLPLLDRYRAMVHLEPWWDGRREALVAEMDRAWAKLSRAQQQQALAYARKLYEEGQVP